MKLTLDKSKVGKKVSFSLKKPKKARVDDETQIVQIESYNKDDNKPKPLVIVPPKRVKKSENATMQRQDEDKDDESEPPVYGLTESRGASKDGLKVTQPQQGTNKTAARVREVEPEASPESYKRVPVDQFGAAFLRGLGWKNEDNGESKDWEKGVQSVNEKVKASVHRQEFLGLGAKPDKALAVGKKEMKIDLVKKVQK